MCPSSKSLVVSACVHSVVPRRFTTRSSCLQNTCAPLLLLGENQFQKPYSEATAKVAELGEVVDADPVDPVQMMDEEASKLVKKCYQR